MYTFLTHTGSTKIIQMKAAGIPEREISFTALKL
jgi:hypothetical protein